MVVEIWFGFWVFAFCVRFLLMWVVCFPWVRWWQGRWHLWIKATQDNLSSSICLALRRIVWRWVTCLLCSKLQWLSWPMGVSWKQMTTVWVWILSNLAQPISSLLYLPKGKVSFCFLAFFCFLFLPMAFHCRLQIPSTFYLCFLNKGLEITLLPPPSPLVDCLTEPALFSFHFCHCRLQSLSTFYLHFLNKGSGGHRFFCPPFVDCLTEPTQHAVQPAVQEALDILPVQCWGISDGGFFLSSPIHATSICSTQWFCLFTKMSHSYHFARICFTSIERLCSLLSGNVWLQIFPLNASSFLLTNYSVCEQWNMFYWINCCSIVADICRDSTVNLTALREKHKPYKRARKAGPLIPIHNTVRLEMEEPSSSDVGKSILMDIWFVYPPVLLTTMVWCILGLQDRQYYALLLPL